MAITRGGPWAHFVEACRRHKPNAIDEILIRVICVFTLVMEQFHRRGLLYNLAVDHRPISIRHQGSPSRNPSWLDLQGHAGTDVSTVTPTCGCPKQGAKCRAKRFA